ncbi:Exostosin-1 [Orchesella cincta]|uniref:Exostosin-1 n=1 Tax=Orchesella cincta TaxID=48709 RepID=A0A1D2NDM1_ORCCI|nr:Exostosin-1 [Orchesella cincta]
MRRRPRSPILIIGYITLFLGFLLLLFLWSWQRLPLSDTTLSSLVVTSSRISHQFPDPRTTVEKRKEVDEFYIPESEPYLSVDDLFDYGAQEEKGKKGDGGEPFLDDEMGFSDLHGHGRPVGDDDKKRSGGPCRMETCFNFDRCQITGALKVYVYPLDKFVPISSTYEKILNRIMSSHYYTNDPDEACLFVLSIDTLDRDELSHDYVRNVATRLKKLPYWNNGENHIVFNLYAGTWPSYNETELGFNVGKAILAKASMSVEQFRPNFDISLPLFHPSHPDKGDDLGTAVFNEFPTHKQHVIAFKGKRYVYGIGSETRNSVYHLHNADDVIMVTTCKHGKNWKDMKDERCDEDNKEYDKYDYEVLLQNSTFCLVPRGRRLGSFRFLETLKSGCIPVLLSNGWILPFSEVIDWSACTVMGDERALLQILDIVRSIEPEKIFKIKQQTQIIWNQYLSSVERIVDTTFEIIRDRIQKHSARDLLIWNTAPGALNFDMNFADDIDRFPFHHTGNDNSLRPNFTAIIYVHANAAGPKAVGAYSNSALFRLVKNAGKSKHISKIIVMWNSNRAIPRVWPEVPVPLKIKQATSNTVSQRFLSDEEIETDAIFSLDEEILLSPDEMDFAYSTWKLFPDRLIGYQSRSHYWNEPSEMWHYSSKWTNDYSMILTGASIYHAYYNHLYWIKVPPAALLLVESLQNCEDIVMNFLIVRTTRKTPIKLTWKKIPQDSARSQLSPDRFKQRHTCLNDLAEIYGSMPLRRSNVRLDPVLFRDPVSNLRKKYRQVEVQS